MTLGGPSSGWMAELRSTSRGPSPLTSQDEVFPEPLEQNVPFSETSRTPPPLPPSFKEVRLQMDNADTLNRASDLRAIVSGRESPPSLPLLPSLPRTPQGPAMVCAWH